MLVPFLNSSVVQFFLLPGKLVKNWINRAQFENIQNRLLLRCSLAVSVKAQQRIRLAHTVTFAILSVGETILSKKFDVAFVNHIEIFRCLIVLVNGVVFIKT